MSTHTFTQKAVHAHMCVGRADSHSPNASAYMPTNRLVGQPGGVAGRRQHIFIRFDTCIACVYVCDRLGHSAARLHTKGGRNS